MKRFWSLLGERPARPRPSTVGIVLAVLFAWPAMTAVSPTYPSYMIVFALGGSAWFAWKAMRARAIVGLLLLPVALVWVNPWLGADWFAHEGPAFFLAHSALALLFAVAAYTYTASEKR